MSKYTSSDPDIKRLEPIDRVNYEYDLMYFDTDIRQEVQQSMAAFELLKQPYKVFDRLAEIAKRPRELPVILFAFLFLCVIIVAFIALIVYFFAKKKASKIFLGNVLMYCTILVIMIILFFWILSKYTERMQFLFTQVG